MHEVCITVTFQASSMYKSAFIAENEGQKDEEKEHTETKILGQKEGT